MAGSNFMFLSSNSKNTPNLLQSLPRGLHLRGERKWSCHSVASEITGFCNMHLYDNIHQQDYYYCDVSSVAEHRLSCETVDTERDVSNQISGFQEREDALSISNLPLPFHRNSFNFESDHNSSGLSEIHIRKNHQHGRLKAGIIPLIDMLLSLPGAVPKSTDTLRVGFALLFLFSCLSLSNASELHISQSLDKFHSNSQSWISSELNFDLQDSVETKSDITSKFGFPEFVALTGRLFWYQIPEEAFPNLERISHYKVTEAGSRDIPTWLYLDSNVPGLIFGVPLNSDISHIYISIEAHGMEDHTHKKAAFSEIISINVTNTSRYDGVGVTAKSPSRSNTFNCSSKGNIIFTNFVFTREIVTMSSLERGNIFLGVAKLLNVHTEDISIRVLDASDENGLKLWIQLVKFYDPKLLGRATILSVASGCGNKDENKEEHIESISRIIDTLKQSFSSCRNGLSVDGRLEHLLRYGAWFVNQAGVVISCSEDPLVEMMHPLKELSHHRVRRQVVNAVANDNKHVEKNVISSLSSIVSPTSSMLKSSKMGTGLTSFTSFKMGPVSLDSSLKSVGIPVHTRRVESLNQTGQANMTHMSMTSFLAEPTHSESTIAFTGEVQVQSTKLEGKNSLSSSVMFLNPTSPHAALLPESSILKMFSLDQTDQFVRPLTRMVPSSESTNIIGPPSSSLPTFPTSSYFPPPQLTLLSSSSQQTYMPNIDVLQSMMEESVLVMTSGDEMELIDITVMETSSMVGEIFITPSPTSLSPSFTFFIPSIIDDLSSIALPPSTPSSSDLANTMSTFVFDNDSSSTDNFFFIPTSSFEVVDTALLFDSRMVRSSLSLISSLITSNIYLMSTNDELVLTSFFDIVSIMQSIHSSLGIPDSISFSSVAVLDTTPTLTSSHGTLDSTFLSSVAVLDTTPTFTMLITPTLIATPLSTHSFDMAEAVASFDVSSQVSIDVLFRTTSFFLTASIGDASIDDGLSIFVSDIVSPTDSTGMTQEDTGIFMPSATTIMDEEIFLPLSTDISPEFMSVMVDASSTVVLDTPSSATVTSPPTSIMTDSIFFTTSVVVLLSSATSAFIPVMPIPSVEISVSDESLSNSLPDAISLTEFLEPTRTRREDAVTFPLPVTTVIDVTFLPLTTIGQEFTSNMVDISSAIIVETTAVVITSIMTDSILLTSSVDALLPSATLTFIPILPTPSTEISISDDDLSTFMSDVVSPTFFLDPTRMVTTSIMTDLIFIASSVDALQSSAMSSIIPVMPTADISSAIIVDTPSSALITTPIMTDLIFIVSSVDALLSSATSAIITVMPTAMSEISISDDGLTVFTPDVISLTDIRELTRMRQEDTVTFMPLVTTVIDDETIVFEETSAEIFLPLTTDTDPEFTPVMVDDSSVVVVDTPTAMVTTLSISNMTDSIFSTSSVDASLTTPTSSAVVITPIMTNSIFFASSFDVLMPSAASPIIPIMPLPPSAELSISDDSLSVFMSDVISLTDFLESTRMRQDDTVTFMPLATTVIDDETVIVDGTSSDIFIPLTTDIVAEFTSVMVNASSIVGVDTSILSSAMVTSLPTSSTTDSIFLTRSVDALLSSATSPFIPVMSTGTSDISISDDDINNLISDVISLTDFLMPTTMRQEVTVTFMPPGTTSIDDETISEIFLTLMTDIPKKFTSVLVDASSIVVIDTSISSTMVTSLPTSIMTDPIFLTSSVGTLLSSATASIPVMFSDTSEISISDDGQSMFMSDVISLTEFLELTMSHEDTVTFMPLSTITMDDETSSETFLPLTTDIPLEFMSITIDISSAIIEDTPISSAVVTTSIMTDSIFTISVDASAMSDFIPVMPTPSGEISSSNDGRSIIMSEVVSPTDFQELTSMRQDDTVTFIPTATTFIAVTVEEISSTVIDVETAIVDETSSEIFVPLTIDTDTEFISLIVDTSSIVVEDSPISSVIMTILSISSTTDSIFFTHSVDASLSSATSAFISLMPTPSDDISISDDGLSIFMSNVASLTDFLDPTRMTQEDTVTFIQPTTVIVDETKSEIILPLTTDITKVSISEDGLSIFISEVVSLTDFLEPTSMRREDTMTFLPSSTTVIDDETSFEIFQPMNTDSTPEFSSIMVGVSSIISIVTDLISLTSSIDALLSSGTLSFIAIPDSLDIGLEQTLTLVPDSSGFEPNPTTYFMTVPELSVGSTLPPELSVVSTLTPSSSPATSPGFLCEFIDCNNGSCREIVYGFTCDCFLGWEGDYCEKDTNFCESYPCDPLVSVACIDGNSTFTCKCQVGYSGQNCSIDINECDSNPCMNNATCEDIVGGFSCICQTGFTGQLCEVVHVCEPEPCLNGGSCSVSDSIKFICNCPPEWTGFRCDTPLDPCFIFPCANNGICETITLDYDLVVKCICYPGFEGNFCETVKDPCMSQPCLNEGNCSSLSPTSFACTCPQGFVGTLCQELKDICVPSPCFNNGSCSLDMDGMINCSCSVGYEGFLCENRIDPCESSPCVNNASCTSSSTSNRFECLCLPGYFGLICEEAINPCENSPCFNNSTCIEVTFNNFTCVCNEDYTGMLCNILINTCDSMPCMNNGTCVRLSSKKLICSCAEDYTGLLCDVPINPCDSIPCMNNGSCERLSFENFTCSCAEDYTGVVCDFETDPCSSYPCLNDGSCTKQSITEFICTCVSRYSGNLCEISPNSSPVLLNPVETLFATEGRLFQSTLPTPIFYDPDTGDSSSLTLVLLDSNKLLPNTTWIQLSSDGSSLEAIATSDQLAREGVITEHIFILRAIDLEGDSGDTFVVVKIFPQNPPVLNLLTIFLDGDYTAFSQRLSDRLLFVSLLASFGNRDAGVSDSDVIYLSQFQKGITVTYSNVSISNSNCADFMEWVLTVYSFETLEYTQSFSDAVEPFTLIKTPFIEGPCNTNTTQTATFSIAVNRDAPILLLLIVVPSTIISLLGLVLGLACFIYNRRRRSERRELTTTFMKKTFLNRRPVILSGELRLPARRGFPTILPGEVIFNHKRMGWRGVISREEEEEACILRMEAIGVSDEESEENGEERTVGEESVQYEPVPSFSQQSVELVTCDDPPPKYSLPPLYFYIK